MQNLTVQKICIALVILVFALAAPWITSELLGGNSTPLLVLGATAVALLFVFGLGDRCWWLIPFCLPIEGNLNFLPLNFSLQETAILVVLVYLVLKMIFDHLIPACLRLSINLSGTEIRGAFEH